MKSQNCIQTFRLIEDGYRLRLSLLWHDDIFLLIISL